MISLKFLERQQNNRAASWIYNHKLTMQLSEDDQLTTVYIRRKGQPAHADPQI